MPRKTITNESFTQNRQNVLSKIDVKAGDLTYGKRIELGELFMSNKSELDKFKETFEILHKVTIDFSDFAEVQFYSDYFVEIIEGLKLWIEKEKLLKYEPELEEIRAGIRELGEKIGYFGTIKSIAKNYGKDPDEILTWKYGKVFGILYTDLEEFKYSKKLHKEYDKKWKPSGKY